MGDQGVRFTNALLSTVFSTVVWGTGTSQTARTAKPPAAAINAKKKREVKSFDMVVSVPSFSISRAFIFVCRICIKPYRFFNTFGGYMALVSLFVFTSFYSQKECKHPTKVYTIKLDKVLRPCIP